jgi:hypothetical protein
LSEHMDDVYGQALEKRRRREQWEREQREKKLQQERDRKRAELEEHLQRRAVAWKDHTGSEAPAEDLREWRREYLDEQELVHRAELEARLAEVEDEHYRF